MHVVHYIRHLREEEGGVVRSVLDLTRALAARDCRVTIITTDAGGPVSTTAEDNGPHIELVNLPRPVVGRMNPAVRGRLDALIKTADLVHLHTLWDPHNLLVAAIARRHTVPYVLSTHGMLDDPAFATKRLKKQVFLSLAGNRLLQRAALLHATASGERRQVEARVGGLRIAVVPLVFDIERYRTLPGPELALSRFECLARPGAKLLLLGRIHFIKGPEIAIDALAELSTQHDVQLIMAGPGEEAYISQLKSRASELGVGPRVSFIGMVSGDEKLSLYQACDVFVLPTMQENFGMVFPEALACGLPVVTSESVDTAAELRDAGARLLPRTPQAFASAIAELLDDRRECERLSYLGRQAVFEWLDTDRVIDHYLAMYRSAM